MSRLISKEELDNQTFRARFESEVTPMTTDTDELILAFTEYFKPVCEDIGRLIGKSDFKGGFDEMPLLYQYILTQIDTSTDEGKRQMLDAHTLAIRWEAADAYCKHEAEKLHWKPAEWWKYCWSYSEQ